MILAVHQYMYTLQGNDLGIKQSDAPRHLARFCFMRESPARVAINGREWSDLCENPAIALCSPGQSFSGESHWSLTTLFTPRPGQTIGYVTPSPPHTHSQSCTTATPPCPVPHWSILIRRRKCPLWATLGKSWLLGNDISPTFWPLHKSVPEIWQMHMHRLQRSGHAPATYILRPTTPISGFHLSTEQKPCFILQSITINTITGNPSYPVP